MNQGGFQQVTAASETASAFLDWHTDTFSETASEAEPFEKLYHEIFERVALSASIEKGVTCRRLPSEESAYPYNFLSNIIIESPIVNLFYQSFKNTHKILIHHKREVKSQELSPWQDFYTEGPPDNVWTVSDWVLDAPKECTPPEDISNFKTEMNGLLNSFNQGLPLKRPIGLVSMAEQVAKQLYERREEDIEAWAENLSNNLSKLSD